MKYIKYLATMFAAALAFASCSTDVEKPQLAAPAGDNYPAPVLENFADIIVNSDNSTENVSFVCNKVDFGLSLPVRYQLYLTKDGQEVHVATAYTNVITLIKSDINGTAMNSFGASANTEVELGAYVIAYAGESQIRTEKSNTVTFNVTTYRAALRTWFVCGVYNGWDAGSAPTIWETTGGSNIYAGMYHLTEDAENTPGYSGFKVLPDRAWGGDLGYDAFPSHSANIESSNDGNLLLPAGIWRLSVNIGASSIDAVKVGRFYLAGSWSSDGWSSDFIELVYDPSTNVWTSAAPLSGDTDFKVCYTDESGNITWLGDTGTTADNMPEGRTDAIELGEGNNLKAPAGSHYVVVYTDRTPYLVAYE